MFLILCKIWRFGWNGLRSFEDMRVSMPCEFGLKMPIHASFGGVLGKQKLGNWKLFAALSL